MIALKRVPGQTSIEVAGVTLAAAQPDLYDVAPNYDAGLPVRLEQVFSDVSLSRRTAPSDRARLGFLAVASLGAWLSLGAAGALLYAGAGQLLA